jgi:hypothetical protein
MGRRPWTTRQTVEQCFSLDATRVAKSGALRQPFGTASVHVWRDGLGRPIQAAKILVSRPGLLRLQYEVRGREMDIEVPVRTTRCYFGGYRYWFLCPGRSIVHGCGFRVSRLYLPPGGTRFGCRICWNLTYESAQQHDSRVDRLRKVDHATLAAASQLGTGRFSRLARKALYLNARKARRRLKIGWDTRVGAMP